MMPTWVRIVFPRVCCSCCISVIGIYPATGREPTAFKNPCGVQLNGYQSYDVVCLLPGQRFDRVQLASAAETLQQNIDISQLISTPGKPTRRQSSCINQAARLTAACTLTLVGEELHLHLIQAGRFSRSILLCSAFVSPPKIHCVAQAFTQAGIWFL